MCSRYEKVKPRAVFVHGAGGGGWEWAIWQRVFAAHGWRSVARDLLPVREGLTDTHLHDYAQQVEGWLRDGADLRCDLLIGASLGGLLALAVARNIDAAALVLVNSLVPSNVEPRPACRDYPEIVPWGSARSLSSTLRAMPDADDAARLLAFRRWRDESGAVLREAQETRLDAPSCPVLVIAGEADADVPVETSRALAHFCNGELFVLPGASHVGPLLGRDAARTAERCLGWAERTLAARPVVQ